MGERRGPSNQIQGPCLARCDFPQLAPGDLRSTTFSLPMSLTLFHQAPDIMAAMATHVNNGAVEGPPPPSTAVVGVIGSKQGTGLASDLSLLRISATTHALHQALGALISQVPTTMRLPTAIKIWIPEAIVRRALPQMCKLGAGGPSTQASGSRKRQVKEVRYATDVELHSCDHCSDQQPS